MMLKSQHSGTNTAKVSPQVSPKAGPREPFKNKSAENLVNILMSNLVQAMHWASLLDCFLTHGRGGLMTPSPHLTEGKTEAKC